MLYKFKKELKKQGEIYLKIKARPGASKNQIKDVMSEETIKINIAAPPVKNQANQELVNFLAQEFAVDKNNVKIISGAGDRLKLIKIKHYAG